MRNIYTGIDFASDGIKIVVSEIINNKFYILASTSTDFKSSGIRKGIIVDRQKTVESLNEAIKNIESTIGMRIKEAVVTIASNSPQLSVVSGTVNVLNDEITGDDISNSLSEATVNKVPEGMELLNVIPITFEIDNTSSVTNPKGRRGQYLTVRAVMITVPRENLYSVLEVCNICDVKVSDATFRTIGDYYEVKDNNTDKEVGAIIDIGEDITEISIFNKGIIIKSDIINLGNKNIDKDISYIYGLDLSTSKEIKENFAVCSRKYADINDIINIDINSEGKEQLKINQYEVSEVVEARVSELLKLAKKSINNLTNRKISYIIVTGSVSELTGFSYIVENVLGINSSTLNITNLGIRNNKYSSAFGIIKYYSDKLKFKNTNSSMFDESKIDSLTNKKNAVTASEPKLVSKIFDYFTGD